MDLSCIILSGDLELYVLGMLPEEEAHKIQQLAAIFPEVQAEINSISQSLEGLAATAVKVPSSSVKENLMRKLRDLQADEDKEGTAIIIPATNAASTTEHNIDNDTAPVINMHKTSNRNTLMAAAVIGILFSIGIIIYLVSINNNNKNQIVSLNNKIDSLHTSVNQKQEQLTALSQSMHILQNDAYKKVKLTSVPKMPPAEVQLFWNKQTHEVYVGNMSLPKTPQDKQYQLWAIVDGKPVDAGMLTEDTTRLQKMKPFEKADAFAITLEKKGGSPTPTMQAMYVMGKVSEG